MILKFLAEQPSWDNNFPKPEVRFHGDFVDIENVPLFAANSKKRDKITGETVHITDEHLDKAVKNWAEEKERAGGFLMPLKEDHFRTGPKVGLVDDLHRAGSWVFGTLKNIARKYYEEEIKTGHRGYCSAEYYPYEYRFSSVGLLGAGPPEIKMPALETLLNFSLDNRRGLFCFGEEGGLTKTVSYVPLLKFADDRGPGGHKPDGTGPYGRGQGPGRGRADGSGMRQIVRKEKGDMPGPKNDNDKKKEEGKLDYKSLFAAAMNELPEEKEKEFMEKFGLKYADEPANDADEPANDTNKDDKDKKPFADDDDEDKQEFVQGYLDDLGNFRPIRTASPKYGSTGGKAYSKRLGGDTKAGRKRARTAPYSEDGEPLTFAEAFPEEALMFAEMKSENEALKTESNAFKKKFVAMDENARDKDFRVKADKLALNFAVDVDSLCKLAEGRNDKEREELLEFAEKNTREIPFEEYGAGDMPSRVTGKNYVEEINPLVLKYSEEHEGIPWHEAYDEMSQKGLLPARKA